MNATALPHAITEWYGENARDLPWRREGFSAWGTLVSEFMLQQTPVSRVIPRLAEWLDRWPTPADLASVPSGEAVRAWASLGYPRRALWLHAAAVQITERHGGIVPEDVDDLLALTGIGDYTARAVAAFAFGLRHPVVDTNVRRVIARAIDGNAAYGRRHPVVDTNTRRVIARAVTGQAEPAPPHRRDLDDMELLLPADPVEAAEFNAGIMELGAVVCTSRSPRCDACPIRDVCAWRAAGYPQYDGPRKAVQKKFEGSDRQVRGLIMAELRATHHPVTSGEIEGLWADPVQRDRALAGLVSDGLAVTIAPGLYALSHG